MTGQVQIVVAGAGAAGMMAAVTAARQGAKVVLIEPNEKVGRKLYITGKGRCNVTNDCREMCIRDSGWRTTGRCAPRRSTLRPFVKR